MESDGALPDVGRGSADPRREPLGVDSKDEDVQTRVCP